MQTLTDILKTVNNSSNIKIAPSTDGSVKYSIDARFWKGNGFNSKVAKSGVYTLESASSLDPNESVILLISEQNGESIPVIARNTFTTPQETVRLLAAAINGGGDSVDTRGYTASFTGQILTIMGKPGMPFTVTPSIGWGEVGLPAIPVITQTVVPVCPGNLPAGRAVVSDIAANYLKGKLDGSVANEPNKIVSLPTGSPTSLLVGVSVTDGFIWDSRDPGCCGVMPPSDDSNCHECVHWLRLEPGNPQQAKVTLEKVTGDTLPVNIIGAPVSYRETGTALYTTIGRFSVGAPVGDTTRKLAKNTANGSQLVVMGVVNTHTNEYFIGVNG